MRFLSLALLIQGIVALPDPPARPPAGASAAPAPPSPTGKPPLRPGDCSSSYYRPQPYGHFINNTIYTPIGNESITYPRHVELTDGTLLATGSLRGRRTPSAFPIFQSKDGGATWRWISDVEDKVNGWGFGAQPALAELTEPMGGYAAGTVLASGNSASNNGTRIDLYASVDKGRSWKFVSRVAEGGRPNTTNGADPIWEPYLLQYRDEGKVKLVAYYSDQRDKLHGQKLAHQVSEDLVNWGPVVNDVAYEQYIARPGMTVVAYIPPIDQWILVHEFPVGNSSSHGVNYPVYYRLSKSPLDFRLSPGLPIVIDDRIAPNASPYVVWSPIGGSNGTIVVSDADNKVVYTNRAGGDVDKWEVHDTPAGATYSRSIHILKDHPDSLLLFGGETFDDMGAHLLTPFTVTSVSLTDILQNW